MKTRHFAQLVALSALWGASFLFLRVASPVLGPNVLAVGRIGLATVTLALIMAALKQRWPWRHWVELTRLGALSVAVPFLLYAWAALRLHGHGALRNELQTVLERERSGDDQRREFAQRVSCSRIGFYAERLGHDYRVKEYGGLRHFGLLELVVRAGEHDVRNTETEDIIGFFEKLLCFGDVVVKVFAHTDRLCTLSGKYVCVLHNFLRILCLRRQRYEFIS